MKSIARRAPLYAVVLFAVAFSFCADAAEKEVRLPGARPVVEAIHYASLQEAIDEMPPEGGVVHLPPGTFEIKKPLVIHQEDVLLRGSGTASHIKNTNTDGKPALVMEPGTDEEGKQKDRQWRIQLSDFRITGNEKSGPGIVAKRVNEIYIDGISVSYHGGSGIVLDHCYEDPRICNSLITYNKGTGLDLQGCHDIVVSANHFEENQDALHCFDGFNLCMTGNNLDDHLGHGVVIENTYGSVVSGNMIEECKGFAIVLGRDCYGDTVSANVIAHNGGGVDLPDAHGCSVSANTFTIMKDNALRIGPESGRITVTGNNFSDSYIGEGKLKRREGDRAAAGMTFNGAKNLAVSGNVFSGVHPKALDLKGDPSRGILFSNNVLLDTKSDHGKLKESTVVNILQPDEEKSK